MFSLNFTLYRRKMCKKSHFSTIECDFGYRKCFILKEKIVFENSGLNFTVDIQNASLKKKNSLYSAESAKI